MHLGTPPGEFAVEVEHRDGSATVRVRGELDVHTAPVLADALETADGRGDRLVVDLSDVELIDSTALAVLLTAARRAPDERLLVVLERPDLRRIFAITGVGRFFDFRTMGEAA